MRRIGEEAIKLTDAELAVNLFKQAVTQQNYPLDAPADLQWLWRFADAHNIRAAIAAPLLRICPDMDEEARLDWRECLYKNKRKKMMYDVERERIYSALDERGIMHAPLKGIILNDLYPDQGIREFADNDILIDSEKRDDAERAMLGLGYKFDKSSTIVHYIFHKEPLFNFELHHRLFPEKEEYSAFQGYFNSLPSRLIKSGPSEYSYSLTAEDSYLYILAHAYKHFTESGIGLRILSDIYLYKKQISMDENLLEKGLKKLDIADFARSLEDLSNAVFAFDGQFELSMLSESRQSLLDTIIGSGAFGSAEEYFKRNYRKLSKKNGKASTLSYYRKRLFPSMDAYEKKYPTLYKHKALHPVFYVYRPVRSVITNGKKLRLELKTVSKAKKEEKGK